MFLGIQLSHACGHILWGMALWCKFPILWVSAGLPFGKALAKVSSFRDVYWNNPIMNPVELCKVLNLIRWRTTSVFVVHTGHLFKWSMTNEISVLREAVSKLCSIIKGYKGDARIWWSVCTNHNSNRVSDNIDDKFPNNSYEMTAKTIWIAFSLGLSLVYTSF